jgi:hypothetical protein
MKTKTGFLKSSVDKTIRLIKRKREKIQISNIRDEKSDLITILQILKEN